MPTKKKSSSKKTTKKPHSPYRIRIAKETENFWDFKFSVQSLYWVLIGIGVIGTTIINFNTNAQINDFLSEINMEQSNNVVLDTPAVPAKKPNN